MTYDVCYKVNGYFAVDVKNTDTDKAFQEAESAYYDADFGELDDIQSEEHKNDGDGTVIFKISGRYYTNVTADTRKKAEHLAELNWCDADFGVLRDVNGQMHSLECA